VATTALSTAFSLALLWVLAALYRRHRIDVLRHKLFCLRADLFDMARRGGLEFDHPAYAGLRTTLNGFLRYAERIGLLSTVLTSRVVRHVPTDSNIWFWERQWTTALDTVDPAVRAQLTAIRDRMHAAVFEHFLLSSPALVLTVLPFAILSVVRDAGRHVVGRASLKVYRRVEESFERKVGRPLDSVAYRVGMAA
jgi:hypothetical protein